MRPTPSTITPGLETSRRFTGPRTRCSDIRVRPVGGQLQSRPGCARTQPPAAVRTQLRQPKEPGPVSATPSRFIGETELPAYVRSLTAVVLHSDQGNRSLRPVSGPQQTCHQTNSGQDPPAPHAGHKNPVSGYHAETQDHHHHAGRTNVPDRFAHLQAGRNHRRRLPREEASRSKSSRLPPARSISAILKAATPLHSASTCFPSA